MTTSGPLARECTRMSMVPKSSFTDSATSFNLQVQPINHCPMQQIQVMSHATSGYEMVIYCEILKSWHHAKINANNLYLNCPFARPSIALICFYLQQIHCQEKSRSQQIISKRQQTEERKKD